MKENQELRKKVTDLESKFAESESDLEKKENHMPKTRLFSSLFQTKQQDRFEMNIINAVKKEQRDEEKKEKNILIFGTEHCDNEETDQKLVEEILETIGVEKSKVRNIKRFKKKEGKNATPILVEMANRESKIETLKKAKTLRSSVRHKGVFIGPDQTQAEREYTKELLKKRKELNDSIGQDCGYRFGIRNNEIVKIRINQGMSD